MSAFMCSERHLTVLAAYAVRRCYEGLPAILQVTYVAHPNDWERRTRQRVFEALRHANQKSLERLCPDDPGSSEAYKLDVPTLTRKEDETLPLETIIKACHCYNYQAGDYPDWQGSAAQRVVAAIEADAVRELPGYDAAPWGL